MGKCNLELEELFKEYNLNGDGYTRTAKIAKIFDVSTAAVRKWIYSGKLKATLYNDDYYIRKKDAREFIIKYFGSKQ